MGRDEIIALMAASIYAGMPRKDKNYRPIQSRAQAISEALALYDETVLKVRPEIKQWQQ